MTNRLVVKHSKFLASVILVFSLLSCKERSDILAPKPKKEILFSDETQKNFLESEGISLSSFGSRARFDFNTQRIRGQPKSPMVHTYQIVGAAIPLAASFPASFITNIPHSIQIALERYEIDQVDILFTPQLMVRAIDSSLKPGYWLFSDRPALDEIRGAPPEFNKTILMGVFDSDYPIEDQVKSNRMDPFHVFFHDGLVSPDTGHLDFQNVPNVSFSFYSLVISEEQKRAAVTLHWMLTEDDRDTIVSLLQATYVSEKNTFKELVIRMNSALNCFMGMQKLLDLVHL